MSDKRYGDLQQLISELVTHMQVSGIWSTEVPEISALQSDKPFCVDTLSFEQWLQFVMVPTFVQMIQDQTALPEQCDIAPMAQEMWKDQYLEVQMCIKAMDQLITSR